MKELLPVIPLWFLRTARNYAKHRRLPIFGETVKFHVISYLRLAHAASIVKPKHWLGVPQAARFLGISTIFYRTHKTAIVRWLRPPLVILS